MSKATWDGTRIFPDADIFAQAPSKSIDYVVMEKADRVAVVPVTMGWNDLGSWDALHAISEQDHAGNAYGGEVLAIDTQGCLVRTNRIKLNLVGVSDLIVVRATIMSSFYRADVARKPKSSSKRCSIE